MARLVVMLSGIPIFNPFNSLYIQPHVTSGGFIYQNIISSISEVQTASLAQIITDMTGHLWIGIFCLLGLSGLVLRHPVLAVAYAPLAGFALLNYVIGNRAIFYSAPMMWFGGAWLLSTLFRLSTARFYPQIWPIDLPDPKAKFQKTSSLFAGMVMLVVAFFASPRDFLPQPSFSLPVMTAFKALEDLKKPGIIASWWDYGYASRFLNGAPTLHDGGNFTGPATHFMARALVTNDLNQTAAILRFLVRDGTHFLAWYKSKSSQANSAHNNSDAAGFDRLIAARNNWPAPTVYLVLTGEMERWMHSISKTANWDIDKGRAKTIQLDYWQSSYVRLFHRRETGKGPFKLIYDDYPHVRVFMLDNSAQLVFLPLA